MRSEFVSLDCSIRMNDRRYSSCIDRNGRCGSVQKFMNQPVSLFSYGLDKVKVRLDELLKKGVFGSDWSEV